MKSKPILLTTSSLLAVDLLMHGSAVLAQSVDHVAPVSTTSQPDHAAEDESEIAAPIATPQPIAAPEPTAPSTQASTLKPYTVDASSMPVVTPTAIVAPDQPSTSMEFSGTTTATVPLTEIASSSTPSTAPESPTLAETPQPSASPPSNVTNPADPRSPEVLPTPASTPQDPQASPPTSQPSRPLGVQPVAGTAVSPLMTTLPLNGQVINHQTAWDIRSDYNLGSGSNNYLSFSALYRLGSQIRQGFSSDKIFSSEFSGTYTQFQTLRTQRVVEVSRNDPYTMLGLTIQMTLTGACVDNSGDQAAGATQCRLLPPLVTDRNSVNDLFIPTRIDQPGKLGDTVSAETLKILAQPGFQNVGANGETVGMDLYFPNIGTIPGNNSGTTSFYSQSEQVSTTSLTGYSRVSQILRTNDTEAVMGITVRGAAMIWNQAGALVNSLLGVATEALPTIVPNLRGGTNAASTKVNLNIFRAANSLRLPDNSWTLYQAGMISAVHNHIDANGATVVPSAQALSLWVGLSPVTRRELTTTVRYQATGPEEILSATGAEGGAAENLRFLSNTNGAVLDTASMRNFYAQIYLTFLKRDVNLVVSDRLTETTTYHPHISLSGSITDTNQSFRYYGGVITADALKPYIGGDYNLNGSNWGISVGGIGYLNPDRDYFSHVRVGATYAIPTGSDSGLILATGMRYAFSQTSNSLDQPVDNFVNVGARFRWGGMSLGLTQYFGNVLPDSISSATGVDATVNLGAVSLQGYYAPSNTQASYGVLATYRLGDPHNNLGLAIGWRRDAFNLGTSPSSNSLSTGNDVLTLQLRLGGSS